MGQRKKKTSPTASVANEPTRRPGRQGLFHGEKLEWMVSSFEEPYSDAVRANDTGPFYSCITHKFLDRYGYDLPVNQNPPPGVDLAALNPTPISDLPIEDQENETKRRQKYFEYLREVSEVRD